MSVGGFCLSCDSGPLLSNKVVRKMRPRPPGREIHAGRGLCAACYDTARREGTLDEVARPVLDMGTDAVVARADALRAEHPEWTWPRIAAELGVSFKTLDAARQRWRRQRGIAPDPLRSNGCGPHGWDWFEDVRDSEAV